MEIRNVAITLEQAKEWFEGNNNSLKEIALQAFTEEELTSKPFEKITTFKKAIESLNLNTQEITNICDTLKKISKASAAIFKLNLVRKALHLNYTLELTKNLKNSYIWYPYNPFITKDSTYYSRELKSGIMEIIGQIKSNNTTFTVLGGFAYDGGLAGFGTFGSKTGVGTADTNVAFLGCANEEIAKHFSKYFGMLITEAKFGDIKDFKIIK